MSEITKIIVSFLLAAIVAVIPVYGIFMGSGLLLLYLNFELFKCPFSKIPIEHSVNISIQCKVTEGLMGLSMYIVVPISFIILILIFYRPIKERFK